MTRITFSVTDTLSSISPQSWNSLVEGNPFLSYEFLNALHETGCASRRTGWLPQYLLLWEDDVLAGAVPLYLKSHSRGEYVFDYSWANAYDRHGIAYYPKLVSAVPFTAVTGPRLLAQNSEHKVLLAQGAVALADQLEVSSLHILFPDSSDMEALRGMGFMLREGVQFHWKNVGFKSFDAFLDVMTREKRKKVKQDRRHVTDAGVTFRRLRGQEITKKDLDFFYQCYETTYHNHYSAPYLTPSFFRAIHEEMSDSMLLVVAMEGKEPIASALNFIGSDSLYGRYWGAKKFISGLHFETCYMQAIEYCIDNSISYFEGGAQGEHKLARGLLPSATWSAHWVANEDFANAIERFLQHETSGMNQYIDELDAHSPFKNKS